MYLRALQLTSFGPSLFDRPISGGQYNPAVSLAITLRGGMSVSEMIYYSIAQLIGAMLGGFCGGIVAARRTVTVKKCQCALELFYAEVRLANCGVD